MSRTFEGDFEHLLKAIREWAEIGNPMPAKNANEKLSWLFQQYGIVPDTPAGREQQRTAQRRLQEATRGENGRPIFRTKRDPESRRPEGFAAARSPGAATPGSRHRAG